MASLYNARLKELAPICRAIGAHVTTMSITSAEAQGGKQAAFDVDLEWDPEDNPDARFEAYRCVLGAYGSDRDMVRVQMDFHDLLGSRGGRLVADTSDLTLELVSDEPAFAAYAHGLHREMRHMCDLWETEIGYVDSDLRALIKGYGGHAAACAFLAEPTSARVLARLAVVGKAPMSLEYLVLRPEWRSLFTEAECGVAWSRLATCGQEVGYP